jgi:hypothetical protein
MRKTVEWMTLLRILAAAHNSAMKQGVSVGITIALLIGGINPAMATLIKFDFTFTSASESGSGSLEAIDNGDGSFTAVSGFGSEIGTITDSFNLFPNSNAPGISFSPSGYFFYDNQLFPNNLDLLISNPGLLFITASGRELNLFSNGPSNYIDYENNGFNVQTSFHLFAATDQVTPAQLPDLPGSSTDTAIPEPSSIALLSLGLLGLWFARRHGAKIRHS